MTDWQDMETAPRDRVVMLRVEWQDYRPVRDADLNLRQENFTIAMEFPAEIRSYMDKSDQEVYAWTAVVEECHPPSWENGKLWENSAKPVGWREVG